MISTILKVLEESTDKILPTNIFLEKIRVSPVAQTVDPEKLGQVIMNNLEAAIKYGFVSKQDDHVMLLIDRGQREAPNFNVELELAQEDLLHEEAGMSREVEEEPSEGSSGLSRATRARSPYQLRPRKSLAENATVINSSDPNRETAGRRLSMPVANQAAMGSGRGRRRRRRRSASATASRNSRARSRSRSTRSPRSRSRTSSRRRR